MLKAPEENYSKRGEFVVKNWLSVDTPALPEDNQQFWEEIPTD